MAKLYFRHGTMSSGKTLILLAVAHAYEQQGKRVLLLKPSLDTRFRKEIVRSRAGLEKDADVLVDGESTLTPALLEGIHCLLVDEAQFLPPAFVEHLRDVTLRFDVPILCYGLRTDFQTRLFPGSQRLMELADSIEEVKTTCHTCNRKAVFNMRLQGGVATLAGAQVELGLEDRYQSACARCYQRQLQGKGTIGRFISG
ncbi:MAG: thymidine kinase [Silvanigrellales bacterium]|nr:thymidine kinase [Silvanigrellales bacterium]